MTPDQTTRRLAAILAADVVGYSRMIGEDEAGTLAALRLMWREVFNPAVAAHRGRIVKMMGDGALVEFASAVEAAQAAIAVQRAMEERRAPADEKQVALRIGLNLGDIVIDGGDIFGDGVNVAARLEAQAPAGGVLISDAVHAQVRGKVDMEFIDAGELTLKNIAQPVRVWRWGGSPAARVTAFTSPAPAQEKPSIAVLPFANLSNDPEQEFFADGLVEDILTTLSKLSGLIVIARNSSFAYKGRPVDVREAGRELGARYVLEGSVRRSGNRVRITAQLIETASGAHVWAERYDRGIDDIFAVQDEITLILATEMQVSLTEGEQARMRYSTTSNVEAWNYWAQGLAHYRSGVVSRDGVGQARSYWEKALALDPSSASLNAMLAFLHQADARFGWWDDRETAIAKAIAYLERALEIAPDNADAHLFTGLVLQLQHRYDESVAAVRRALERAPGSADVAAYAATMLATAGVYDEGITQMEKAMRLSPKYPANYLGIQGLVYRLAGRTDDAIAAFQAYGERSPGFGHVDLAILYHQTGRLEEARSEMEKFRAARPQATVTNWAATQFRKDRASLAADLVTLRELGLPE